MKHKQNKIINFFYKSFSNKKNPTPLYPSNGKTVYKRDLPKQLIQFSSEKGKMVFKESLQEGNMESYFPLSEQFMTQSGPPTCGPTSLSMVFNALGLDPQKQWKGIWRWWSEDLIEGVTEQQLEQGMDLEYFTHITKHNRASIQTFYYPHKNLQKYQNDIYNCGLSCQKELHRTADFITFKLFLIASSRRTGMYFIVNNSRKTLNQTGNGHFMPIGGVNLQRSLALCLDVARFKYPPYWVDIEQLYQSLEPVDKSTQKSRGFALISKQYDQFSTLCRVSQDYISIENYSNFCNKILEKNNYQGLQLNNEEQINSSFQIIIDNLINEDFQILITYYIFEFLNYQEMQNKKKNNNKCELLLQQIEKIDLYQNIQKNLKYLDQDNNLIILLENSFQQYYLHLLTIILLALPKQITQFNIDKVNQMYDLQQLNKDHCDQILKQIKFLNNSVGFQEISNNINQYQQKQKQRIEIKYNNQQEQLSNQQI